MNFTYILYKNLKLNINYIFKKNSTYILIFILPIFSIIPVLFFFPFWNGASITILINSVLGTAIIFASLTYNWRKSTLYKNSFINGNDKSMIYLSSFMVIIIIETLVFLFHILTLFLFSELNMIVPDWIWSNDRTRGIDILNLIFFAYSWSFYWSVLVMFSISFLAQKFITTTKNFYILILMIMVLCFLWGSTFNDYFAHIGNNGFKSYPNFKAEIYPSEFYFVSLLFPFYPMGQIASVSADFTITSNGNQWGEYINFSGNLISWTSGHEFAWKWNILLVLPAFWVALFALLGILIPNNSKI